MEQRGDLQLLIVNNTGRHFNYPQASSDQLLLFLDKDMDSYLRDL